MSGIYQNLLNPNRTPNNRGFVEVLRDYTHASEIFRTNNYKLAPKHKFLFHVYFEINQGVTQFPIDGNLDPNVSVLVKTIKLPSFTVQQQDMNQYNRKRTVQTKMRYDNIDVTWHDDHSNVMRNLWYNYYTYYYGDSMNSSEVLSGQSAVTQNNDRNSGATYDFTNRNNYTAYNPQLANQTWGFYGETSPGSGKYTAQGQTKAPFFKNVYIYGLSQHTTTVYVLINPMIATFSHDTYAYNEGNGVMENRMTLSYEFVKYSEGKIDGLRPSSSVPNFGLADVYDVRPSPNIDRQDARTWSLGTTALLNPNGGSTRDLSTNKLNSGVNKTSIAYNTYKTQNLEKDVLNEIVTERTQAIIGGAGAALRNANFAFPVFGQSGDTVGTAGAETPAIRTPAPVEPPAGFA